MTILIAEDDPVTRKVLEAMLIKMGHIVVATCNGKEAWQAHLDLNYPKLAIFDWIMPEMDGLELCRKIRNEPSKLITYIIMLTIKGQKQDIVEGLNNGADDYVIKPFNHDELNARVQVGIRMIELQENLAARVKELEDSLLNIKQLQGLLPICSYCKKIRDDNDYWNQVEEYITQHSELKFTHGICPDCYRKIILELEIIKRQ
jgi:phosphoserine phosphatase RsbU/P